jgi:hypothetical protein
MIYVCNHNKIVCAHIPHGTYSIVQPPQGSNNRVLQRVHAHWHVNADSAADVKDLIYGELVRAWNKFVHTCKNVQSVPGKLPSYTITTYICIY